MNRWLKAGLLLALFAPAVAPAAPTYYGWAAGAFIRGPEGADLVAPTVIDARIPTPAAMYVYFSEEPFQGAGYDNAHWTLTCSGGAVTPTLLGIGSISILFSLSRDIAPDETCTLAHDGTTDSIEDAAGNDLAAFSGQAVSVYSDCPSLTGATIGSVIGASVQSLNCSR